MSSPMKANSSSRGGSPRELPAKSGARGYEAEQRSEGVRQRMRLGAGGSVGDGPGRAGSGATGFKQGTTGEGTTGWPRGKTGAGNSGLKRGATGGSKF